VRIMVELVGKKALDVGPTKDARRQTDGVHHGQVDAAS
jgi:hypothetical protein